MKIVAKIVYFLGKNMPVIKYTKSETIPIKTDIKTAFFGGRNTKKIAMITTKIQVKMEIVVFFRILSIICRVTFSIRQIVFLTH